MTSIRNILFFAALALLALEATAMPLGPAEIRLVSEKSGKYVSVASDLSVTASASQTDPDNKFIPTYPSSGSVRLESSSHSGKYLIIENGALKVGTPSNDNDVFDTLAVQHAEELAFKQGTDCFIAFKSDGTVHGPCSLSTNDFETHFTQQNV